MKIEEINAYFKDFDRMGETAVRIAVYSERWRNDLSRLGAAAEWLRLKDEERQSQNSRWARRAANAAYVAAIAATIGAITAVMVNRESIMCFMSSLLNKIIRTP
jgi:transposase